MGAQNWLIYSVKYCFGTWLVVGINVASNSEYYIHVLKCVTWSIPSIGHRTLASVLCVCLVWLVERKLCVQTSQGQGSVCTSVCASSKFGSFPAKSRSVSCVRTNCQLEGGLQCERSSQVPHSRTWSLHCVIMSELQNRPCTVLRVHLCTVYNLYYLFAVSPWNAN